MRRGLGERLAGGRRFLQGAGNVPGLSPSERQSYPLLPSAQTCSPGPRPSQRDSVEPHVVRSLTSLSVPPTNSSRRDPATDSCLGKEKGSRERPRRGDQPLHPQHPRTGGAKHEIHEDLIYRDPIPWASHKLSGARPCPPQKTAVHIVVPLHVVVHQVRRITFFRDYY